MPWESLTPEQKQFQQNKMTVLVPTILDLAEDNPEKVQELEKHWQKKLDEIREVAPN